ncbi:hypothetical protein NL676_030151 [Syzygium grande]|nr:hypothetical protein NL676_030151 [Syzygium grande]
MLFSTSAVSLSLSLSLSSQIQIIIIRLLRPPAPRIISKSHRKPTSHLPAATLGDLKNRIFTRDQVDGRLRDKWT